jgi:hypothetical protein
MHIKPKIQIEFGSHIDERIKNGERLTERLQLNAVIDGVRLTEHGKPTTFACGLVRIGTDVMLPRLNAERRNGKPHLFWLMQMLSWRSTNWHTQCPPTVSNTT